MTSVPLSISIGENGSIPLATLTLKQSRQCSAYTSKPPDHFTSTPPCNSQAKLLYINVLVSIPICEIRNSKRVALATKYLAREARDQVTTIAGREVRAKIRTEAAREARAKVRTEGSREARAKVRTEAAREVRAKVRTGELERPEPR